MNIRRLLFNIEYTHILTFREEYKEVVLPFFGFDNLRYGIDNENTSNESIRLIFQNEKIALFFRKDGFSFLYEGDVSELKNQNGIIKLFWDMYEKIKAMNGYKKTNRHGLIVHSVDIMPNEEVSAIMKSNKFLGVNPFGKLNEFACLYEFSNDGKDQKFAFGNFSARDIKTHDLTPFKTEYNKDLAENVGLMCKYEIFEECKTPSFSKFKTLLTSSEELIKSYIW